MMGTTDLHRGTEGPDPLVVGPLTRTDFVRYQGASGDMNPVHHDEAFARDAGFDAPLGIGMFTAGLMNTYAVDWLGAENVRATRVRWKAPVFPGDTLVCSGKVDRVYEQDVRHHVDIEVVCNKDSGENAAIAWMTFVID